MADETTPDPGTPEPSAPPANTAVAEAPANHLAQTVEMTDVGPCKKHIKITVDRKAIDDRFNEKYTELVRSDTSQVNGFRPGKAPRKVIERRFKSVVEEQVRTEVLMASLEQLATENPISPLAPPDLDPASLEIPESGPFIYEFDIEVRPEFDLGNYKGITLKRIVKTFTPEEIQRQKQRVLEPFGEFVVKEGADAKVTMDDFITVEMTILDGDKELNKLDKLQARVEKRLAMPDGVAEQFGKTMVGAKLGDECSVDMKLSENASDTELRGKTVKAKILVQEIKSVRLPELTRELLSEFGVRNEEQFEELIAAHLERRLQYMQRQSFRKQILGQLADASKWQLPQDLLIRQSKQAMGRRVMEMRSAGMSDEEIMGRRRMLEQDVIMSTANALREHFVLQKIAELEKIEIEEADIDAEIDRIARDSNESPRKIRARLEKDELIEALATELLERQALDLVLQNAVYEEVELKGEDEEGEVAAISEPALVEEPSAE